MLFNSILASALLCAILPFQTRAQATTGTTATTSKTVANGQKIGDFIFKNPPEKGTKVLAKVGTAIRIEWTVSPANIGNPQNVTIESRYGAWPDVSDWKMIAKEVPNENYYDWLIPENQFTNKNYILRITTAKTSSLWIRDRTSQFFQIYSGTPEVDGEVIWRSNADKVAFGGGILASLMFFL